MGRRGQESKRKGEECVKGKGKDSEGRVAPGEEKRVELEGRRKG